MYNSNIPTDQEIPSTGKLIRSTIIAAVVAAVLLVTVVMPAEYGIDPTGIGNVIGLKRMGEIKMSLAKEAAADRQKDGNPPAVDAVEEGTFDPSKTSSDSMTVTLAPDEGTEIKLKMAKGASVTYKWTTDGGKATYDAHADSSKMKIDYHSYHSYEKGSAMEKEGTLTAAFDGSHGWYWRNRNSDTMKVTLEANGSYTNMKHMK